MTERYGVAGMTQEARTWYDTQMLSRAMPLLVHMKYGVTKPIPERGGNAIQWRRLDRAAISTTALTEGTPPAATNVTTISVTATVSQYGQFSYHSDVLESQAIDPIITEIVRMYGEAGGIALDRIVRNVMTGGTTIQYASTASSRGGVGSGMRMTYAEIREAVDTLERNDAMKFDGESYIAVIHPDTKRDMFADSDLQNGWQNAGPRDQSNPLFSGVIGQVYSTNFIVTSEARIQSSAGLSGADVYQSLFFGREYYGISEFSTQNFKTVIKPVGSGGTTDPLNQFGTVGWKASLTAARLNENFAVSVEHTTSRSNAA